MKKPIGPRNSHAYLIEFHPTACIGRYWTKSSLSIGQDKNCLKLPKEVPHSVANQGKRALVPTPSLPRLDTVGTEHTGYALHCSFSMSVLSQHPQTPTTTHTHTHTHRNADTPLGLQTICFCEDWLSAWLICSEQPQTGSPDKRGLWVNAWGDLAPAVQQTYGAFQTSMVLASWVMGAKTQRDSRSNRNGPLWQEQKEFSWKEKR